MNKRCGVCGSEKRYDENHRMYRRGGLCNTKHALKFYFIIKDKRVEKKEKYS